MGLEYPLCQEPTDPGFAPKMDLPSLHLQQTKTLLLSRRKSGPLDVVHGAYDQYSNNMIVVLQARSPSLQLMDLPSSNVLMLLG